MARGRRARAVAQRRLGTSGRRPAGVTVFAFSTGEALFRAQKAWLAASSRPKRTRVTRHPKPGTPRSSLQWPRIPFLLEVL